MAPTLGGRQPGFPGGGVQHLAHHQVMHLVFRRDGGGAHTGCAVGQQHRHELWGLGRHLVAHQRFRQRPQASSAAGACSSLSGMMLLRGSGSWSTPRPGPRSGRHGHDAVARIIAFMLSGGINSPVIRRWGR
jgi:hypothetical protein